jgi:hypothetical protein
MHTQSSPQAATHHRRSLCPWPWKKYPVPARCRPLAGGPVRVPPPARVEPECLARAVTVAVSASQRTAQGDSIDTARQRVDIISAYREVRTPRGAAAISGTTQTLTPWEPPAANE